VSVRGVILAAGLGRRMGVIKQLLPLHGRPILQHVIDAARSSGLEHILLVLGHAHEAIRTKIDCMGIDVTVNPDFAKGQSTSLRTGLVQGPETNGVMFLLGDQPMVGHALIDTLIDAFEAERPPAVQPVHQGRPGNPVILGRELLREAAALTGDTGARPLLQRPGVMHLEVDDSALLRDVDTMDDYLALLAVRQPGQSDFFRP
jgi:molybdenum cofactor cytidylyltransferase